MTQFVATKKVMRKLFKTHSRWSLFYKVQYVDLEKGRTHKIFFKNNIYIVIYKIGNMFLNQIKTREKANYATALVCGLT